MNDDGNFSYIFDSANWTLTDPNGIPQRLLEHAEYSVVALAIAFVIAFPLGLLVGHTNRGAFLAINIGNAGRALPSLGVVMLAIVVLGTGLVPVTVALVILAIPPILTGTYAGVRAVDRSTVDAARGMGMKEFQIVTRVETPIALPIIIGGVRNAALQVISTATIAAYVGEGGLGRLLFDGLSVNDYPQVIASAVLLAAVAVLADQILALLQRLVVSPGVDGRATRGPRKSPTAIPVLNRPDPASNTAP